MNKSQFANRHPYWFVAILEGVVILVYLSAGTVAHFMNLSNLGLEGIANMMLTIMAVLLLSLMGWWRVVGFRRPAKSSDLLYFIVPLLPIAISLIAGLEVNSVLLLQVLAITLLIGFTEEAIFRGLMLNALKAQGIWKAAIITALLFGLSHSLNLLSGQNVANTLVQIFYALAIGFAFSAVVLKTGILWPLVIAHFLIDFTAMLGKADFSPFWNTFLGVGIAIVFANYGVFVMLQNGKAKLRQAASQTFSPAD
jgi:uncharacterized protein